MGGFALEEVEHWLMRFLVAVQLFEITLLTMHLYSVVFVCFVYVSFIVLFMHQAWLCAM